VRWWIGLLQGANYGTLKGKSPAVPPLQFPGDMVAAGDFERREDPYEPRGDDVEGRRASSGPSRASRRCRRPADHLELGSFPRRPTSSLLRTLERKHRQGHGAPLPDGQEPGERHALVEQLKDIEHVGIISRTRSSTSCTHLPHAFDRMDIHALAVKMDDVLDIASTSAPDDRYNITAMPSELGDLAEILHRSSVEINKATPHLRHMKNAPQILEHCIEINRLENEADEKVNVVIESLFTNGYTPYDLIKIKELVENLEAAADKCEDVANLMEGIILRRLTMDATLISSSRSSPSRWSSTSSTASTMPPTPSRRSSRRASSPQAGGHLGGLLQFRRRLHLRLHVATTIGKGIIDPTIVDSFVILAALVGAIVWDLLTWWWGLPTSSSHALIGGMIGAAVAKMADLRPRLVGDFKVSAFILSRRHRVVLGFVDVGPAQLLLCAQRAHEGRQTLPQAPTRFGGAL